MGHGSAVVTPRRTNSQADINLALQTQVGRILVRLDKIDRRLGQIVEDQDLMNSRVAARLTAIEAEVKQRP